MCTLMLTVNGSLWWFLLSTQVVLSSTAQNCISIVQRKPFWWFSSLSGQIKWRLSNVSLFLEQNSLSVLESLCHCSVRKQYQGEFCPQRLITLEITHFNLMEAACLFCWEIKCFLFHGVWTKDFENFHIFSIWDDCSPLREDTSKQISTQDN